MIRAERFNLITSLANEMEIITLESLAEKLNVSMATVRRDVDELCSQGIIEKTRGGIIFCNRKPDIEPSLNIRKYLNMEEKKRIAQAASEYLCDNSYYMLDSGSTIHELVKLIPKQYQLNIVTYDLSFLLELNSLKNADIWFLGGQLRKDHMTCHGSYAENFLEQMNAHIAFIGADSIDLSKGIMGYNAKDVPLKQKMIKNSEQTILLCDHSKFTNHGFINIHSFKGIDVLITDSGTDPETVEKLQNYGIKVEVV